VPEPAAIPWTPCKNDLPPDFVEAVKYFQTHGMGDPRGGKFARAQSELTISWEGALVQQVAWHGWLAKQADGGTRFIAEDGLSHSLYSKLHEERLSLFRPVDPGSSDITARIFERDPELRLRGVENSGLVAHATGVIVSGEMPRPEIPMLPTWQLSEEPTGPDFSDLPSFEVAAALCLIDGHPEVGRKLLAKRRRDRKPYALAMASELLGAKWIRALDAYARGDDQSALALFEDVSALRAAYKTECVRELGQYSADKATAPDEKNWFRFLDQTPELIKETQRRISASNGTGPPSGGRTMPDGVESEIAALDNFGLPFPRVESYVAAGVLSASQIPADLIKAGPIVIAPLIRTMAGDDRLTRRIENEGDALRVASVREIALRIINCVAGSSFHRTRDGKLPSAESLTNWWRKSSKLTPAERAFALLGNDSQDDLQWIYSAEKISGVLPLCAASSAVESRWAALRLRKRENPSVSDLMVRRTSEILTKPASPVTDLEAKVLYECLNRWDPASCQKVVGALSDRLLEIDRDSNGGRAFPRISVNGIGYVRTDPDLLPLVEQQIAFGDRAILPTYQSILLRFSHGPDSVISSCFRFAYEHRNEPEFAGFFKRLFLDPVVQGQWKVSAAKKSWKQPVALDLVDSPLLNLPEEQEAVTRLLEDKSLLWIDSGDDARREVVTTTRMPTPVPPPNSQGGVSAVQRFEFRVCDEATLSFSTNMFSISPSGTRFEFNPLLPTEQKDAIIRSLIDTLRHHPGNVLARLPGWNNVVSPQRFSPLG
jgi:hypothetical protein